ncbi:MAG: PIN domain-containing protein [Thiohalocapsa sp.]|uniref:PIN domain-containing protein n=1 Tax=Thiohalocapsa sp. TaxID=2497641 RepID=UPI0025F75461|nr:PIN domain-containing protein [Thiohalocapsa sp.]MCG6940830.1 PIN domain-containing protein [Thiohalocapsa sp.]
MPERFSIDTNILIYSVDADAGERHEQAMALLDQMAEHDCVLTLQALAEFFHAVTRKDKMPLADASAMVQDWMTLFPTVAADARTLPAAIELRAGHGFAFWDAMPVQTAKAAGVTRFLTEAMQDGRQLGSLTLQNPFTPQFTF